MHTDVLRWDPGLFLEKWGKHLNQHHLSYFEEVKGDYYVDFYLKKFRYTEQDMDKKIRNRRYGCLRQLIDKGSYFTEEEMRLRSPLLYETYIGQYLPNQEQSAMRTFDNSMNLSDRLFYEIDYSQALQREEEMEGNIDELREKDLTEQPLNIANSRLNPELDEEERDLLRRQFRALMEERFLRGEDQDFDYSLVDSDENYEYFAERDADIEEKYFEEEQES